MPIIYKVYNILISPRGSLGIELLSYLSRISSLQYELDLILELNIKIVVGW